VKESAVHYPALEQLMGAYLHQDYDLFGATPMAAVDAFLDDEPALGRALPDEIAHLLAVTESDQALEDLLDDLGCEIQVDDPGGYRTWLEQIAERARRS
jgi:hypothetical protein